MCVSSLWVEVGGMNAVIMVGVWFREIVFVVEG